MKLVKIKWVDSRGANESWEWVEKATHKICECVSVGYVIHDDDEGIHIAPHIADNSKQFCGSMMIPKVAVISIERLMIKERDEP